MPKTQKTLSPKETEALLLTLKARFEKHTARHQWVDWAKVEAKLVKSPEKLWSLNEMEKTWGEPDVVSIGKTWEILFIDCSPESPKDRRSVCYDRAALNSRKEFKPKNTVIDMCEEMWVELLDEVMYRELQTLGEFDLKTSSWVLTPAPIRKLGGAIFCDRRYNQVFTYHNGAESYYGVRGFRLILKV